MNVKDALRAAQDLITSDSATRDAQILLSSALNKSLIWLKTWPDYLLSGDEVARFWRGVDRRIAGEPIAYIIGEKGFWTLNLKTNSSTLIPRPETELVVELALAFLSNRAKASLLDLGTGTGAIALAIAAERPGDNVYGCDLNQAAVELAEQNAAENHINNVKLFQSNWFSAVHYDSFDLIVSNPPYIDKDDPHLARGDVVFEPTAALISANKGFFDIQKIIYEAKNYLVSGGGLIVEHGFEQAEKVRYFFYDAGYSLVTTTRDLANLERVTMGTYTG